MRSLTLIEAEEELLRLRHRKEFAAEQLAISDRSLLRMQRAERVRSKSIIVMEYIIERDYEEVITLFEDTVSKGLQELFNDKYGFRLLLDRSGVNTSCTFEVATDECPVFQNLRMTQGKSVQEIIAALMRMVICWIDKEIMNVVLMDEPFGGLTPNRKEKAAEFLQNICKDFGMQLLVVTQHPEMCDYADNSITTKKKRKLIC